MIIDIWCLTDKNNNKVLQISSSEEKAQIKFDDTLGAKENAKIVKRRAIKYKNKYYLIDDSDDFWFDGFKLKLLYDPKERVLEKQKSREEDQKALESGEKTQEDLRRENGAFSFPNVKIKMGQLY